MQVNFNPSINYKYSFKSLKKENTSNKTFSEKEIRLAKTKKAISEIRTIVFGVGILYFAMKRNLKINAIKNAAKKARDLAIKKAPVVNVNPLDIEQFLKI